MLKKYKLTLSDGSIHEYEFQAIKKNEAIVVAVAKDEEQYIEEWVQHYLNLGFDRIFIGDNNEVGNNSFSEILKKYIDCGKVVVLDCKFGDIPFQSEFYNMFTLTPDYWWAFFCDIDEFLELNCFTNIKDFLKTKTDQNMVFFKWVNYGNNGIQENDKRPVQERFKYPLPLNISDNLPFKTIIKGLSPVTYEIHGPFFMDYNNITMNYHDGYLKHYKYKSIEEQKERAKRKFAYTRKKYNVQIHDFSSNITYHNDLIGKYNGLRNETYNICDNAHNVVKFVFDNSFEQQHAIFERIHSVCEVILKSMPMVEKTYFWLDQPIHEDQFLALFEMALHTNNKICVQEPKLENNNIKVIVLNNPLNYIAPKK